MKTFYLIEYSPSQGLFHVGKITDQSVLGSEELDWEPITLITEEFHDWYPMLHDMLWYAKTQADNYGKSKMYMYRFILQQIAYKLSEYYETKQ